jgi:hypothetical protein
MAYVDLNTLHNPTTGGKPPATYGDQIRSNFEALKSSLAGITSIRRTTNYTINQSAFASATDIFSSDLTWTADGTTEYWIEFSCARLQTGGSAGSEVVVSMTDGASNLIAHFGYVGTGDGTRSHSAPVFARIPYTPSAGTATINARGIYISAGNGTAYAGSGYPDMRLEVFGLL